jgi:predicted acyltransferase (DUF342 family)
MFRNLLIVTVVTLASTGAIVSAEVVDMQAGQFAVLAGKKVEIGSGASITGNVGSISSDIDLSSGVTIYGDLFAGDDLLISKNSAIHGDAISGEYTSLGSGVSIGRIDAGARRSNRNYQITAGAGSSIGAMYSTGAVSLGSGVQVNGDTSAAKFSAGSKLIYTGRITSADNVTLGVETMLTGQIHAAHDVKIGDDSTVNGGVYASHKLTLGKRASAGALHGKDVTLSYDASSGSVFASRNAKIDKGGTVSGSVNAGDDAELKKDSSVSGDVTYGHKLHKDKAASVSGTTAKGAAAAPTAPDTTLTAPRDFATSLRLAPTFASGGSDVKIKANRTASLSAGTYKKLTVEEGAKLTLTAGTYNFSDVLLGKSVRLTADTSAGAIVINSADDFKIDEGGIVVRFGAGEIIVSSGDDMDFGKDVSVVGDYRAYDDFSADNNFAIAGRAYARENLTLGGGATIFTGDSASVTPEPGTLILLAVGAVGVVSRRRRRKCAAA